MEKEARRARREVWRDGGRRKEDRGKKNEIFLWERLSSRDSNDFFDLPLTAYRLPFTADYHFNLAIPYQDRGFLA